MTMMFLTNVDFLLKFYERCKEEGLDTVDERMDLLVKMAMENSGQCSISETKRDKEQIIKDLQKNYGNILYVDPDADDKLL